MYVITWIYVLKPYRVFYVFYPFSFRKADYNSSRSVDTCRIDHTVHAGDVAVIWADVEMMTTATYTM